MDDSCIGSVCMYVCVCIHVPGTKMSELCKSLSHIHTDEGVYVNSAGGQIKDIRLQWGEVPSSIGKCIPIQIHTYMYAIMLVYLCIVLLTFSLSSTDW